MANTRELRRRIKSVKSTAQITKAMQMVAATKMRRAQNQAINGRSYSLNLSSALERLLPKVSTEAHPLLSGNGSKKTGVAILSTDKSLCGALNTNLFRLLINLQLPADTLFYTIGKKGRNFVAKSGKNLKGDFENSDAVTFRQAVLLSKMLMDSYLAGEIGEAYLVYPGFISTLRQEPTRVKLLPVSLQDLPKENSKSKEFLFEPDVDKMLDYVLVHHIQIKIYQALLETKASEHSARMMTMQNATDNALELVDDLKLTYNQTRQGAITNELLEITTAALAMN